MDDPFLALGPLPEQVNVVEHLLGHATRAGEQEAIVDRSGPGRRSCTFAELSRVLLDALNLADQFLQAIRTVEQRHSDTVLNGAGLELVRAVRAV